VIATGRFAMANLWGMTLLERLLRQLSQIGIDQASVICSSPLQLQDFVRPDFSKWTKIRVDTVEMDQGTTERSIPEFNGRALVIDAGVVVDNRILEYLKETDRDIRCDMDNRFVGATTHAGYLDPAELVHESDISTYIQATRKRVGPFVIAVNSGEDLRLAEKITFAAVYKGATDFITKYVFYLPARWVVRMISPTAITPNQVTLLSMLLSFGAIVPFFTGQYWVATIMGFAMAFLDTVDGKLARVTFRTSKSGDLLDHVSDFVYLLAWYIGLGWSLSGGALLDMSNQIAQIHALLIASFVADKIATGLYKRLYGYELHDYTRLDYSVRIFIARRNPFLLCMLIALVLGNAVIGLILITVWYVLTLAFHLMRFIYLPMSGEKHQYESS
jgi:phosphatidylglycerophosphate synthase